MTPDQWRQIEDLYSAARKCQPNERAALLERTNPEIRSRVERMLAQDSGSQILDWPVGSLLDSATKAIISSGAEFGPYRIETLIGAGGMGAVYRAIDTRLGRVVAIKIAAERYSERFRREAQAISTLNHPNICTLHDVGPNYLVMELIEGPTLAAEIKKGPMAPEKVARYGAQIAGALAEAHALGIVHRDLKPANIMLTRHGVKVLDFGLAKFVTPGQDETATASHAVMGTVAYMSPEQARGEPLDARTDLWSLGVILYEMATGALPFPGQTSALIFDAILNQSAAPVSARNLRVPAELDRVIAKLLEKNREYRYQSAADVEADLKRAEGDASSNGSPVSVKAQPRRRRGWLAYGLPAALAILLVAGGVLLWPRLHAKALTDQDVVVVGGFTNSTGDAAFEGTLRQALALQLERSPFLKTLSDVQLRQDFRLLGRSPADRITDELARDVCVREGDKAMIGGAIANLGRSYAITLEASNCQTGDTLARAQAQADSKEHVLKAVEEAALTIRAKLGESLSSIPKGREFYFTTTSLDAFQMLSKGRDQFNQGLYLESIPTFRRATELDSKFATAWLFLATAYVQAGVFDAHIIEYYKRAYDLREGASEPEQFFIPGFYFGAIGELDKALDTFQAWSRAYPREGLPPFMVGNIYVAKGQLEDALPEILKGYRREPQIATYAPTLIALYYLLNRFDDAKAISATALAQHPDDPDLHAVLLLIAYAQDDAGAAQAQISWFAGRSEEYMGLEIQAPQAFSLGQRRKAEELLRRAAELRRRRSMTLLAGFSDQDQALIGDCKAALSAPVPGALALALCGDSAKAAKSLASLQEAAKQSPTNTLLNALFLPMMRASVELKRNRPLPAIEQLNSIGSFERVAPGVTYLRGCAYLEAGKGADARAEFQKILDRKVVDAGEDPRSPFSLVVRSVSYVGLARAASLAGDTAQAKKAYQDFLALWQDADPDVPILTQARKEYAALH